MAVPALFLVGQSRKGPAAPLRLAAFGSVVVKFAPYCFLLRTVGRIFNDYYQSKRLSGVDAPDISIHHPTKLYTSTNYITAKLTTTARPQRLSLGF